MTSRLAGLRALLIDLEGTVYQAGRPIPGAVEAIGALAARGVAFAFVTNTTSRPRRAIVEELSAMGLGVTPDLIFTAPRAARAYLAARNFLRCHFLLNPAVLEDIAGIDPVNERPDAVVLGDIGEEFSFSRLNRAFRFALEGAELVTLARNRYYSGEDGLLLDVGPFTAALEYAAGRPATLVGKPSPVFFSGALAALDADPSGSAVVGDDLEGDVAGGQNAGLTGILVRTGKFREGDLERSSVQPDFVIGSLADLPGLL